VLQLHQLPVQPVDGVDPALMAVLLPALSLEPEDRPEAAAFRDQLAALKLPGDGPDADDQAAAGRAGTGPAETGASAVAADPGVRTRTRRRPLVLALVALLLVAGLVATLGLLGRSEQPVAATLPSATAATTGAPSTAPSPTASARPEQPTASAAPTPPALPDGFEDCSDDLGDGAYCRTSPECWAGVISVQDSPYIATAQDCDETHVYQTFVAAVLDDDVRKQSQLESTRSVKNRCTRKTLDDRLRPQDRATDWEIIAVPPQAEDGAARVYRCIFGLGDRRGPIPLVLPR